MRCTNRKVPTRTTFTASNIIDLIITDTPHIAKSGVIVCGISDHELIYIVRKKAAPTHERTTFKGRSYKRLDVGRLRTELHALDWNTLFSCSDPEMCWQILVSNITIVADAMCPIKQFKISKVKKNWVHDTLLEMINDRDQARNKFRRTKTPEDNAQYIHLRNQTKKCVDVARQEFTKHNLHKYEGDVKKFWKYIQELFPSSTCNNGVIKLTDSVTDKEIEMHQTADYINEFFTNIGPNLTELFTAKWETDMLQCIHSLPDMDTNEDEVYKLIKDINIYKSSAIDHLSAILLKPAFLALVPQLTHVFNLCLTQGIFPNCWKVASVIPLQKDGDKSDVSNLRPISLLPLPGKLLEKIIHKNIMAFLNTYDLLDVRQGGFRKDHSTVKKIGDLTDDLYVAMNNQEVTTAVFIDFKKAFDTVSHNILIQKLELHGVKGMNLKLMKNYLSNRRQCVIANNIKSTLRSISCGVPQGSILGPLLFLIYVNDMPKCVKQCTVQLYADDTVIYFSNKCHIHAKDVLQRDLDNLQVWCQKNKLTVNVKKTKSMIFGTARRIRSLGDLDLKMQNMSLSQVTSYKYLGVVLDQSLTYTQHLQKLSKSISHKIYMLIRMRRYLTTRASEMVYKMMILPFFDYADVFYEACPKHLLSKLQRMQNRALRCILGPPFIRASSNVLHNKLNLSTLEVRRHQHLANFMFKRSKQIEYHDIKDRRTRTQDKIILKVQHPKIEKTKNAICFKGSILWNSLDLDHQRSESYSSFKLKTKKLTPIY